jgi:hypothetical protein
MNMYNLVNSISYDGFPYLTVNGKDFVWNGFFWQLTCFD